MLITLRQQTLRIRIMSAYVLNILKSTSVLYAYSFVQSIVLPSTTHISNLADYEGVEIRIVNCQAYIIHVHNISVRNERSGTGSFASWYNSNFSVMLMMGDVLVVRLINFAGTLKWLIMSREKNYYGNYRNSDGTEVY